MDDHPVCPESMMQRILTMLTHNENKNRFALLALSVFSFTVMAYGYRYLSTAFCGDAALISQQGEELYQVSLGRFLQPVYWQIRGHIIAPFLVGLFSTAFNVLSCWLISRILQIRRTISLILLGGLVSVNEVFTVSNITYLPWTDVYSLSLLLMCAGVYCFFRFRFGFLASTVLFTAGLALYQSYLSAASTLFILAFLVRLLSGTKPREIWMQGLLAVGVLAASLFLYKFALAAVLDLMHIEASWEYNGVARVNDLTPEKFLSLLPSAYTMPLLFHFSPGGRQVIYSHYALIPRPVNWLLLILCAFLLLRRLRGMKPGGILTAGFLILVLPFSMNFIMIIASGTVNGLMIYAYFLPYLFPLMLWDHDETPRLLTLSAVSLPVLCLVLLINIWCANTLTLKRDLEFQSTLSIMSRVLERAEDLEGYVPGETPVLIDGILNATRMTMERKGYETIRQMQGAWYTVSAAYESAMNWYLMHILGERMNLVPYRQRQKVLDTLDVSALEAYPSEKCVRIIDGYLVLKI